MSHKVAAVLKKLEIKIVIEERMETGNGKGILEDFLVF